MKTQLHSLPDPEQALAQLPWDQAPDPDTIDQAVRRELTKGLVTFEPLPQGDLIQPGCRVTLKTVSPLPKYNREKTVLTVGSNLYNPDLERMLVGMCAGQSGRIEIQGKTVSFWILQAERKAYPPLTDEMVRSQQLEGISTLQQYRDYMAKKLRQEFARQLCETLLDQLIQGASMDDPDPEDIRQVIDREYQPIHDRFSSPEEDLDTMSPEQWKENFYNPSMKMYYEQIYPDIAPLFDTTSKESYYEHRRQPARRTIRRCLVLRALLQDDSDAHDPTLSLQAEPELLKTMTDRLCARLETKG